MSKQDFARDQILQIVTDKNRERVQSLIVTCKNQPKKRFLKYALRLGMESIENYNNTDFDCRLAQAVAATPIFVDGPEQLQPSQERIQSGNQPRSQTSLKPLPPFQSLVNYPVNYPVNFPVGPRSRKIKLEERNPVDLRRLNEAREAKRKWREEFWLREEQQKIQELFEIKDSAILCSKEKARRAEKELEKVNSQVAKFKKVVTKSEDRSRKIASANARMLKYISEKL